MECEKGLNHRKFEAKHNCCCEIWFRWILRKNGDIVTSQCIQTGFRIGLIFFDDIQGQNGACGHYQIKETRELICLFMTFDNIALKMVPAAAITKKHNSMN